jgi:DNA-binding protein H-NS
LNRRTLWAFGNQHAADTEGAKPLEFIPVTADLDAGQAAGREDTKPNGAASSAGPTSEVRAKYRDPKTGETWSGRGRMATWLKRKQDAGEDIDDYLV